MIINFIFTILNKFININSLVMKKIILLYFIFFLSVSTSFCQSYLGLTTKNSKIRDFPNKNSKTSATLKINTQVFLYSLDTINGYYKIIHIESNKEGWLHHTTVKLVKELPKNESSPFTAERSYGTECLVDVFNNTSISMTLKIDTNYYYFEPKEKKSLSLYPNRYSYVASAPFVIPYFGEENFNAGYKYSWTFYIDVKIGSRRKSSSRRKRK
jgi:hypothetical protein